MTGQTTAAAQQINPYIYLTLLNDPADAELTFFQGSTAYIENGKNGTLTRTCAHCDARITLSSWQVKRLNEIYAIPEATNRVSELAELTLKPMDGCTRGHLAWSKEHPDPHGEPVACKACIRARPIEQEGRSGETDCSVCCAVGLTVVFLSVLSVVAGVIYGIYQDISHGP